MPRALLGLGSNLGDRRGQLLRAFSAIDALPATRLLARSRFCETAPVGGPGDQPPFLNAAASVSTSLPPRSLLQRLLDIERQLGRLRDERWAPRVLDVDLLCYEGERMRSPELELPHPRMQYRRFVLGPAAEVAPWVWHAASGWTVGQLLRHLDHSPPCIALAAKEVATGDRLIGQIAQTLGLPSGELEAELQACGESAATSPKIGLWPGRMIRVDGKSLGQSRLGELRRPRLTIGVAPRETAGGPASRQPIDARPTGDPTTDWRRILQLPPTGPIAWIDVERDEAAALESAVAAIQAAWPELA